MHAQQARSLLLVAGSRDERTHLQRRVSRSLRMRNTIYRGWRDLPSDVQFTDVTVPRQGTRTGTSVPKDFRHVRRREPVNRLLPHTVDWILSLPTEVRPHLLASRFAHIANWLCSTWHDPEATRHCFDDLLTDRRGGRQGFPLVVLKELQHLRKYCRRIHREPEDRWHGYLR
jgi:hypothetical protein